MIEIFGDDYLKQDNEILQIEEPSEIHETIQRLSTSSKLKTMEERKEEARCMRLRQAQITQYSLEPTYVILDTVKLIPKEEQPIENTNTDMELEIHLNEEERTTIEAEIIITKEDKPLSNRAKKRKEWVKNIGKIRNSE